MGIKIFVTDPTLLCFKYTNICCITILYFQSCFHGHNHVSVTVATIIFSRLSSYHFFLVCNLMNYLSNHEFRRANENEPHVTITTKLNEFIVNRLVLHLDWIWWKVYKGLHLIKILLGHDSMHVKDKIKSLPSNNMFYRIKSLIITCNRFSSSHRCFSTFLYIWSNPFFTCEYTIHND